MSNFIDSEFQLDELALYRGKNLSINSYIELKQPTIDDICSFGERNYYATITQMCVTPSDMKSELYDNYQIWWDEIDDFDLFTLTYKMFNKESTSLVFKNNIDISHMQIVRDNVSQDIKLLDVDSGVFIDRIIYEKIVTYLRRIHSLRKNEEKGGNKITKQFMVEEDRDNKRALLLKKNPDKKSILLPMISALTNHANFKYRYDDVWTLPVFVFMDAVQRINAIDSYQNLMHGYYSGCVDIKKLKDKSILNWMGNIQR